MEDTAGAGDLGIRDDRAHPDDRAHAGDQARDAAELAPEPGHLAELPRSLAVVTTTREGDVLEHKLLLLPGATAADVTAAMILMPPAAPLVGHRGVTDLVLVFREPVVPAPDAVVWRADRDATGRNRE